MIGAFNALASVAADKRQEALGLNIAIAMNTTAFGLIVAIPCIAAHVFLTNVTKKIIDEIDQYSVKLRTSSFPVRPEICPRKDNRRRNWTRGSLRRAVNLPSLSGGKLDGTSPIRTST